MTASEAIKTIVNQMNKFNTGKPYTKKEVINAITYNVSIEQIQEQVDFLREQGITD